MDIFYTAALDGTVKLWDLRSMQDIWMVRMDGKDEGNQYYQVLKVKNSGRIDGFRIFGCFISWMYI